MLIHEHFMDATLAYTHTYTCIQTSKQELTLVFEYRIARIYSINIHTLTYTYIWMYTFFIVNA